MASTPDPFVRGAWAHAVERARKVAHDLEIPAGAPVFPGTKSGYHRTLTCYRILGKTVGGTWEELWISYPDCVPPRIRWRESAERTFVHRTISKKGRRALRGLSEWACEDRARREGAALREVWVVKRADKRHFWTGTKKTRAQILSRYDCGRHRGRSHPRAEAFIDPSGVPELR